MKTLHKHIINTADNSIKCSIYLIYALNAHIARIKTQIVKLSELNYRALVVGNDGLVFSKFFRSPALVKLIDKQTTVIGKTFGVHMPYES